MSPIDPGLNVWSRKHLFTFTIYILYYYYFLPTFYLTFILLPIFYLTFIFFTYLYLSKKYKRCTLDILIYLLSDPGLRLEPGPHLWLVINETRASVA